MSDIHLTAPTRFVGHCWGGLDHLISIHSPHHNLPSACRLPATAIKRKPFEVVAETTWILYEIWQSKADSDAHQHKPDVQAFFAKAPQLLAGEPKIFQLGQLIQRNACGHMTRRRR